MDENLDVGRLNRQFLQLWLAITLCPRSRPRFAHPPAPAGIRAHSDVIPALPRREPERWQDDSASLSAGQPHFHG